MILFEWYSADVRPCRSFVYWFILLPFYRETTSSPPNIHVSSVIYAPKHTNTSSKFDWQLLLHMFFIPHNNTIIANWKSHLLTILMWPYISLLIGEKKLQKRRSEQNWINIPFLGSPLFSAKENEHNYSFKTKPKDRNCFIKLKMEKFRVFK